MQDLYSSEWDFIKKLLFRDSLPCLAYPFGLALLEVESLFGGEVVAVAVAVVVAVLIVLRVRGAAHEPVLGEQGFRGTHLVLA
jgi:hypothetical protein